MSVRAKKIAAKLDDALHDAHDISAQVGKLAIRVAELACELGTVQTAAVVGLSAKEGTMKINFQYDRPSDSTRMIASTE